MVVCCAKPLELPGLWEFQVYESAGLMGVLGLWELLRRIL